MAKITCSSVSTVSNGLPILGCLPLLPPTVIRKCRCSAFKRSKWQDWMHTPHWTHLSSLSSDMPLRIFIAFSLQYSTQDPHPVQRPGVRKGRTLPMTPISLSMGLVQAFGQPDRAMRIFTGISFPNNFLSIFLARLIVSIFANLQRSTPGHAMIFTISSFSEPTGVSFFARAFSTFFSSTGLTCGISKVWRVVQ